MAEQRSAFFRCFGWRYTLRPLTLRPLSGFRGKPPFHIVRTGIASRKIVLPGLGPGIHVLVTGRMPAQEVVDGRAKPGQDGYLGLCEDLTPSRFCRTEQRWPSLAMRERAVTLNGCRTLSGAEKVGKPGTVCDNPAVAAACRAAPDLEVAR